MADDKPKTRKQKIINAVGNLVFWCCLGAWTIAEIGEARRLSDLEEVVYLIAKRVYAEDYEDVYRKAKKTMVQQEQAGCSPYEIQHTGRVVERERPVPLDRSTVRIQVPDLQDTAPPSVWLRSYTF